MMMIVRTVMGTQIVSRYLIHRNAFRTIDGWRRLLDLGIHEYRTRNNEYSNYS